MYFVEILSRKMKQLFSLTIQNWLTREWENICFDYRIFLISIIPIQCQNKRRKKKMFIFLSFVRINAKHWESESILDRCIYTYSEWHVAVWSESHWTFALLFLSFFLLLYPYHCLMLCQVSQCAWFELLSLLSLFFSLYLALIVFNAFSHTYGKQSTTVITHNIIALVVKHPICLDFRKMNWIRFQRNLNFLKELRWVNCDGTKMAIFWITSRQEIWILMSEIISTSVWASYCK